MNLSHHHLVRVRFSEVDSMGFVHHAVFFTWFEIGRTELLRSLGKAYKEITSQGFHLPVVEAGCRYRYPARYDEVLAIETHIQDLNPIQVKFYYRVLSQGTGKILAEGFTRHAVINHEGKLLKVPQDIYRLLQTYYSSMEDLLQKDLLPAHPSTQENSNLNEDKNAP